MVSAIGLPPRSLTLTRFGYRFKFRASLIGDDQSVPRMATSSSAWGSVIAVASMSFLISCTRCAPLSSEWIDMEIPISLTDQRAG